MNEGLTITENAKIKINNLWGADDMTPKHFVRVAVKAGGCSGLSYDLSFDNENLDIEDSAADVDEDSATDNSGEVLDETSLSKDEKEGVKILKSMNWARNLITKNLNFPRRHVFCMWL